MEHPPKEEAPVPSFSTMGYEELLWCSDSEFDSRVNHLTVSEVLDLVQALQAAMELEQQTFDSLRQQLAQAAADTETHERLSTALCSSQARLACLCARNMRCFMQAVRAKQSPSPVTDAVAVTNLGQTEGDLVTRPTKSNAQLRLTMMTGHRRGGSEDDTGTEEGEEEEEEEEGSEEGSGSSGFHSLPRPPRKSIAPTDTTVATANATPVVDGAHEDTTKQQQQQQQQRVPSVDEILCSVKRLRNNHTEMVKSALKTCPAGSVASSENKTFLHGHLAARSMSSAIEDTKISDETDSPFYENVVLNTSAAKTKSPPSLIYENLNATSETHIYDKPRTNNIYDTPHNALEDDDDIEAVYENINFATGKTSDNELSDDSTVYENIEPVSKKQSLVSADQVTYDVPLNSTPIYASVNNSLKNFTSTDESAKNKLDIASLVPQSTRMLLNGRHQMRPSHEDKSNTKDVDQDSLEEMPPLGEESRTANDSDSEPDIPSPDYGSEDDDEEDEGEFCCDDLPGLQEDADVRTYYSEEQGLAVILEEPEEEEERSSSAASSECSPWPATASSSNESGLAADVGSTATATPKVAAEQDRMLDAYKETVRQRFARAKLADTFNLQYEDDKSEETTKQNGSDESDEKKLPSVRNLRSHFEIPAVATKPTSMMLREDQRSNGTDSGIPSLTEDTYSSDQDIHTSMRSDTVPTANAVPEEDENDYVEPIFSQFSDVNEEEEIRKPRPTTRAWDPVLLLRELYSIPEPFKSSSSKTQCVTIEGYLEKLPSGKKKATFWNAWKRRYFRAKDGFLYYYQNNQSEKPSMTMQLMGGKVDSLESTILGVEDRQPMVSTMLGIDDGKGHYVVVRCATKQETERWRLALMTHIVENFSSTYIHPWPIPRDPALIKDTIIIDLGSSSIRAGVLCTQPSLPQLFFPTIMAIDKMTKKRLYGEKALRPEVRSTSTIHYPVRPSAKITKYSVDISAVTGFLQKIFQDLNVDQKLYDVILSVPRSFNTSTQTELLNILFDQFQVRAVNMTHQSVLALYAYNATSGIVVDIGERMDIVPISDGYIVENGVSRIPYGGSQIIDHLRHFLMQKQYSLVTEVESFLIRYVLETMCYCAQNYNSELNKCRQNPPSVEYTVSIKEFFDDPHSHWETITLDSGRFQPTEGLFNPEAWGLDNPGVQKMVHKAIQECSMDVRKEMTRSIYLSGGVTMLPGFAERLHIEIDKVTPAALIPKVHVSPYRYHAAYIGACVLANSVGVDQMKIGSKEWSQSGFSALKKWTL